MVRSELMSPYGSPSTNTTAYAVPDALEVTPCPASQFGRSRDTASYAVVTSAWAAAISSPLRILAIRDPTSTGGLPDVPPPELQPKMAATATRKRCLPDI